MSKIFNYDVYFDCNYITVLVCLDDLLFYSSNLTSGDGNWRSVFLLNFYISQLHREGYLRIHTSLLGLSIVEAVYNKGKSNRQMEGVILKWDEFWWGWNITYIWSIQYILYCKYITALSKNVRRSQFEIVLCKRWT